MTTVSFGWNQNHQLGHGDAEIRVVPHVVTTLEQSPMVQVVCGSRYTIALSREGNVYSWGRGDDSQLGHLKGASLVTVPRLIQSLESIKVVSVAARGAHSMALTLDGNVYSWGRNDEGQLGQGHRLPCKAPTLIEYFVANSITVTKIACGRVHSVVVSEEEHLYSWGDDDDGATGLDVGEPVLEPSRVESLSHVTEVACGSRHTLVLTEDENADNDMTQAFHMGNQLYAFGWGTYGQLGLGDRKTRVLPCPVQFPRPKENAQRVRVTQIACGYRHSLAVLTSFVPGQEESFSSLFTWGWNQYGQLGAATPGSSFSLLPVQVRGLPDSVVGVCGGGRHSLAIVQRDADGARRMYSWGRNDDGQLGMGVTFSDQHQPARVKCFGRDVHSVAAGWSHTVALLEDSSSEDDDKVNPRAFMTRSPSTQFLAERKRQLMESTMGSPGVRSGVLGAVTERLSEIFGYGNLDAGFAQFLNTLILLLNLLASLKVRVGLDQDVVIGQIVPGATLTVFMSNMVFGGWAEIKTNKADGEEFTALPHGINTVLFFAFTMLIMVPVFEKTGDSVLAYHTGLACCFILGVLEIPCLFLVEVIRKVIPRAAMMSAMAGVSLTFIAMTFTVQIFSNPAVGIIPMAVILVCYGSNVQLPYKIPAGLLALVLGSIILWAARAMDLTLMDPASEKAPTASDGTSPDFFLPSSSIPAVFHALFDPRTWPYITVVIPMLIVNIVTNLSCLEGAEAIGEAYSVRQGLFLDALLTIAGSLVGNPFPTCIYIGHGAFKSMGATSGYSYLSAAAVLLLGITNGTSVVMQVVPEVAGVGILMWIGIVVTAQAFDRDDDYMQESSSSKSHAAAVALGLLPALAAWALQYIQATLPACATVLSTTSVQQSIPFDKVMIQLESSGVFVYGLISLSRGYLLSSIFLSSMLVEIIDRKFYNAALWMFFASVLAFIGAVHSFELDEHGISSSYGFPSRTVGDFPLKYAFAYAGAAVLLLLFEMREHGGSLASVLENLSRVWNRRMHPRKGRVGSADSQLHVASPTPDSPFPGAISSGSNTVLNYKQSFDEDDEKLQDVAKETSALLGTAAQQKYS